MRKIGQLSYTGHLDSHDCNGLNCCNYIRHFAQEAANIDQVFFYYYFTESKLFNDIPNELKGFNSVMIILKLVF